jgi:hypothetical protein
VYARVHEPRIAVTRTFYVVSNDNNDDDDNACN